MNKISGMHELIQALRAKDKVKQMTHSEAFPILSTHVLNGLIRILERVESSCDSQGQGFLQKKGELKFYTRTNYLALAVRCGDSIDSLDMIGAIEDSSYYLAHKWCLNSSDFVHFLTLTEVVAKGSYFISQQHHQLESCLNQLLGSENKLSTPFEFTAAVANHLNSSSIAGIIECLIEFAITIPETAQFSSEEIFVACCLLIAEKANSSSFSSLLMQNFEGAIGKGGQLMQLMKDLFTSIGFDV